MSVKIASPVQHRPQRDSAFCTCGKIREQCVRQAIRTLWKRAA